MIPAEDDHSEALDPKSQHLNSRTPAQMHILVVEDEKKLAHFICQALTRGGHAADACHQGDEAWRLIEKTPFDAVVLDVMVPADDGLTILKRMRAEKNETPVLVLTARGSTAERIEGLNLGADDYMAKPFDMDELIARLNALFRRAGSDRSTILKIEDLTVNLVKREVSRAGQKIELTPREFGLLEFLMRSPGRAFTRTQLCEYVWNWRFDSDTNVVEVYIQRLRRKIDEGHAVKLIHTVRGVGYTLDPSK